MSTLVIQKLKEKGFTEEQIDLVEKLLDGDICRYCFKERNKMCSCSDDE